MTRVVSVLSVLLLGVVLVARGQEAAGEVIADADKTNIKISLRDGVVVVALSRVTEGRPCFGAPFSRERRYIYEVRPSPLGWLAQLIIRPTPPISFPRTRSALLR
jgi:hypothetical protein